MRTNKELIQIALDNLDKYFGSGLCLYIRILRSHNIINVEEVNILSNIIENTPIRKFYQFWRDKSIPTTHHEYWWNFGEIEPRRKYLQYLLKRYETKIK